MRLILAPAIVLFAFGCSAFQPTPVAQHTAPAPPAPLVDSTMTQGDTADIQARLRDAGFYHGPIDGRWGSGTEGAMRAYQRDRNLEQTGRMNAATHSLLYP